MGSEGDGGEVIASQFDDGNVGGFVVGEDFGDGVDFAVAGHGDVGFVFVA